MATGVAVERAAGDVGEQKKTTPWSGARVGLIGAHAVVAAVAAHIATFFEENLESSGASGRKPHAPHLVLARLNNVAVERLTGTSCARWQNKSCVW